MMSASPRLADIDHPSCTSAKGLGRVKTCPREQRAELFSLLSFLDSAHQHCYFFNLQKSRQTFYPQIQFWSFHTAKTHKRHGLGHRRPVPELASGHCELAADRRVWLGGVQLAPQFSAGPRSAPIVKWIRIVGIYCKSHFSLVQQIQLPPRRKTQEAMTAWSC